MLHTMDRTVSACILPQTFIVINNPRAEWTTITIYETFDCSPHGALSTGTDYHRPLYYGTQGSIIGVYEITYEHQAAAETGKPYDHDNCLLAACGHGPPAAMSSTTHWTMHSSVD